MDAWPCLLELEDHRGQELVGEAFGCRDADLAGAQPAQREDFFGHALDVQPGPARMGGEQFTCGVGRHAARLALEEQCVELPFQAADLPAHGRRRHVETAGRLGHRARADQLHEVAQRHLLQHALVDGLAGGLAVGG
ncbi:hypothetical protein FQZ97_1047740 [compost metagenome]